MIVVFALALGQFIDGAVLESELVEPIQRLCRKQEQFLVAFHAADRDEVAHNRVADSGLAIVRADRDACNFGHAVFEFVKRAAAVDAVIDAIDNVILEFFGDAFLRSRHKESFVDVVLHDAQDIGDVFHVRGPNTGVLVRVHHGAVAPCAEHFLQKAPLEFTGKQMYAVRARLASVDGVHQIIHLRKSERVGIEFQKFLRLVHVHCGDEPVVGGFEVLGVLTGHKSAKLDAVLVTDEEKLANLQVLAKFSRKFRTADVVGVSNLVPADGGYDGHEFFVHQLFQEIALDAFNLSRAHVVHAVDHAEAPRQDPVALDAGKSARSEVAHDALGNAQ